MPNSTRISVSENYLGLSDGFYQNDPVFIQNFEANRAYLIST
jgi:hypothetical protein